MSNVTATATIENDINYTLIKLGSNQQTESASLNYSRSLTNGTGNFQINYGVISSGALPSGGKLYFDLQSFTKTSFDVSSSIQFSRVESIVVENNQPTGNILYADINIHATGGNAWTEPWNGGSGAQLIKPYSVWQYSDPISGAVVDGSNKDFTLEDVSGTGALYSVIVVGITG